MMRLALIAEAACCTIVVALGLFVMLESTAPARASFIIFLAMGLLGLAGLWRQGERQTLFAGMAPVLLVVAGVLAGPIW
jgi:hypothetical protein